MTKSRSDKREMAERIAGALPANPTERDMSQAVANQIAASLAEEDLRKACGLLLQAGMVLEESIERALDRLNDGRAVEAAVVLREALAWVRERAAR